MQNPSVLYHASNNAELKIIEPRAISRRDEKEGKVVFATPDRAFATCFIVKTDDSWTASGFINGRPFMLIGDKERFLDADKGGAVYALPISNFTCDINKGLGKNEWTAVVPIRPLSKQVFASGLNAMLENGIVVYFIDEAGLRAFRASADKHEYLKKLNNAN